MDIRSKTQGEYTKTQATKTQISRFVRPKLKILAIFFRSIRRCLSKYNNFLSKTRQISSKTQEFTHISRYTLQKTQIFREIYYHPFAGKSPKKACIRQILDKYQYQFNQGHQLTIADKMQTIRPKFVAGIART